MKTPIAALAAALVFAAPAQATLNISDKPTKNVDCSRGFCFANADNANLNTGDLAALLATSDIRVLTEDEVAQDILVLSPLSWASNHALSLETEDAIFVRSPITVEGTAHLTLAVPGGPIFQKRGAVRFANTDSALTIEGSDYKLVNSIQSLAAAVAAHPLGTFALANDYNAHQDGVYSRDPVLTFFKGTFDGLGNTISNFAITDSEDSYVALFVAISRIATIRNLGLANVKVRGTTTFTNETAAALVAYNSGQIVNCHATGSVTAVNNGTAGGLLGGDRGIVDRSWANVQVTGAVGGHAGGLIGFTDKGLVIDSYSLGAVQGGDFGDAGGLIGHNAGRVRTSYSTGAVTSGQSTTIGGAFGSSPPKSKSVYWNTETSGTENGVGDGSSDGVSGLTTAEMQAALPEGFSPTIWGQSAKINNGLPYLLTDPPR